VFCRVFASALSFRTFNESFVLLILISESVLKVGNSVGREELHSMGICMGKFTRTKKFRLHITALEIMAQYAKVGLISFVLNISVIVFMSSLCFFPVAMNSTRSG
jgi:ribosome biogenesis protein Nip4